MRGRIGGWIGKSTLPNGTAAKGSWGLGEVFLARKGYLGAYYDDYYGGYQPPGSGSTWPAGDVSISWPTANYYPYPEMNYSDATVSGEASFSPTVTSSYGSVSYSWERSTNGGTSWAAVPGESSASLVLPGQTIDEDGDQYRLVVNAGLKQFRSSPGFLRFDTVTISNISITAESYSGGSIYLSVVSYDCVGTEYGESYEASFQWQQSTNGGVSWSNISGATGAYTSFAGSVSNLYRVKATFASVVAYSAGISVYSYE